MNVVNTIKSLPVAVVCLSAMALATQANAVDIRQSQIDSCTNELVTYQITDAASANQLCTCTVDVRANMTIGQMWEIESYVQSGRDPATLPYASAMQQQMQQCTDGITLNPPQMPPQAQQPQQ